MSVDLDIAGDGAGRVETIREAMIHLPGGRFRMGSDADYPEEAPSRMVSVGPFWIDPTPVTNAEFAHFVDATGYVTFAERPPNPADYPGIRPELIQPGSLLFVQPNGPVPLHDPTAWWTFCLGADWRHPHGPGSSLGGLMDHPVVHIAYADAEAFATWAGKSLPTEAEWEYAARGGLEGKPFAWGDELAPGGELLANYWTGRFPWEHVGPHGHGRTSPVQSFPPNGFGLHDMIGNVWEWTQDWYAVPSTVAVNTCCTLNNPRGGQESGSYDPCIPHIRIGRKVLKGGSHLCAPNYCQRYRPSARYAQSIDTSTSHIGLRCVIRT